MEKDLKDLLLKDLCARLPYGVKCKVWYNDRTLDIKCTGIDFYTNTVNLDVPEDDNAKVYVDNIKPYLFPLSSMTEEQKKELDKRFNVIDIYGDNIQIHYHSQGYWDTDLEVDFQDWLWLINWLNKNHFDYNGLIEKGLAIDCTNLNIY